MTLLSPNAVTVTSSTTFTPSRQHKYLDYVLVAPGRSGVYELHIS